MSPTGRRYTDSAEYQTIQAWNGRATVLRHALWFVLGLFVSGFAAALYVGRLATKDELARSAVEERMRQEERLEAHAARGHDDVRKAIHEAELRLAKIETRVDFIHDTVAAIARRVGVRNAPQR